MSGATPKTATEVAIMRLPHGEGLRLPAYQSAGAAGMDLLAAIATGIAIALPTHCEAQVRPRSGLALKSRIGLLNSPGTIDSDYRGEVGVILFNFGEVDYTVHRGDRIAQLVFARVPNVTLVELTELDATGRGSGGFGHTG